MNKKFVYAFSEGNVTAWELLTLGADRLGSSRLVKLAEACEAETERADG